MKINGLYTEEQKKSESYYSRATVVEGDLTRFKKFTDKCATANEDVVICFLGGSITWGGNASEPDKTSYPHVVFEWLKKRYPNTNFKFFKQGIPGTGSVIASERLERDILSRNPDFVLVEFSVNDGDNPLDKEAYESIIRAMLSHPNAPAVMHLANVHTYGDSSERMHAEICRHYGVPLVSLKPALAEVGPDWMPDTTHPNDEGHQILSNMVTMKIADVAANSDEIFGDISFDLPNAITNAGFVDCKSVSMKDLDIVSLGDWEILENGSIECHKAGEPLIITVPASYFMIKYEQRPDFDSTVKVTVDGDEVCDICNRSFFYNVVRELCLKKEPSSHRVEIKMTEGTKFNISQAYLANFPK